MVHLRALAKALRLRRVGEAREATWQSRSIEGPYREGLVISEAGNANPVGVVLMFPGFTSRRQNSTNTRLATRLVAHGFRCVTCDLSGHGDSEGSIADQTILKAADEIVAVVDDLLSHSRFKRVAVVGNSFSGNAAIIAAARDPRIGALALKSPVTDYVLMRAEQLGPERMKEWRERGRITLDDGTPSNYRFVEDAEQVDAYDLLKTLEIPVLAVQGSDDEQIPAASRHRLGALLQETGKDYLLLKGADHNLSDPHFDTVIDEFERFLLRHAPRD